MPGPNLEDDLIPEGIKEMMREDAERQYARELDSGDELATHGAASKNMADILAQKGKTLDPIIDQDDLRRRVAEAEAKLQAAEEIRCAGETVEALEDKLNLIDEISAEVDDQALKAAAEIAGKVFGTDKERVEQLVVLALRECGLTVEHYNAVTLKGDREGDWLISIRARPVK